MKNRKSLVLIRVLCTGILVAFYLQCCDVLHFSAPQWGPVGFCSLVSTARPHGVCHCKLSVYSVRFKHLAVNSSCRFYKLVQCLLRTRLFGMGCLLGLPLLAAFSISLTCGAGEPPQFSTQQFWTNSV